MDALSHTPLKSGWVSFCLKDPAAARAAIVAEALSWESTAFHDMAGVKGVGTDCAHHLIGVAVNVGAIEPYEPHYAPQFFQHRDEPLFLQELEAHGARRIEAADALAGDVLMYSYGRQPAHCGIIVDAQTVVHAFKLVGRVTRGSRRELEHRLHSAWSILPEIA